MRIVFAGGGTGGHVYPILAVADALRERVEDLETLFIGTRSGLEATVVPETVELTLSGPDHLASSLRAEDVRVLVDAMGLPRGTHDLVPEVHVPEGIDVHGVTPARVTVTLK